MSLRGAAVAFTALAIGVILALLTSTMDWDPFPGSAYAGSREVYRPDDIRRAVYVDERLWLITEGGQLWSVSESNPAPTREAADLKALELCSYKGAPAILSRTGGSASWTFQVREDRGWVALRTISPRGDEPLALDCTQGPRLITSRRLIDLAPPQAQETTLAKRLPTQVDNASLALSNRILISFHHGEAGTALYEIDPKSGAVDHLKSPRAGECVGFLTACDAVTDLSPIPWKPGCAAAAVSSNHIGSHGRIIELCGRTIKRVHLGPCPFPSDNEVDENGEPLCAEPFVGVMARDGTLLLLGTEGLTEYGPSGPTPAAPLPEIRNYGPFRIAFGPDFVLVNRTGQAGEYEAFNLMLVPKSVPARRLAA